MAQVNPSHERPVPEGRAPQAPDFFLEPIQGLAALAPPRFMVPMHAQSRKAALHEIRLNGPLAARGSGPSVTFSRELRFLPCQRYLMA